MQRVREDSEDRQDRQDHNKLVVEKMKTPCFDAPLLFFTVELLLMLYTKHTIRALSETCKQFRDIVFSGGVVRDLGRRIRINLRDTYPAWAMRQTIQKDVREFDIVTSRLDAEYLSAVLYRLAFMGARIERLNIESSICPDFTPCAPYLREFTMTSSGFSILQDNLCGIGICTCLLYTSPSPRDRQKSRMPSSA